MDNKTSEQLKRIAKDHAFYTHEKRYQALIELEQRNDLDKDLNVILESFRGGKDDELLKSRYFNDSNKDLTEDLNAPKLYSRRVIYMFSLFFSVIAGCVLLSRNLRETGKLGASIVVAFIGPICLYLLVYLFSYLSSDFRVGGAVNAIISIGITELFWNRYIGKDIQYRKRSFVFPLIIWFLLTIIVIYMLIVAEAY